MGENQRSIIWATMDEAGLNRELLRLRSRISEALEQGDAYGAKQWRQWIEEILLELELRSERPSLTVA